MTDEMLALAEENKRKSGLENVEFLKGEIEHIPLPDNSVDVIISNCVINLSGDKDRVMREAFRVLKPGGRFAVSDVVVRGEVPPAIRKSMELWVGCVAGALSDYEYVAKLARAGFEAIGIETTRVYTIEDARTFLAGEGLDADALATQVERHVHQRVRPRHQACGDSRLLRSGLLRLSPGDADAASHEARDENRLAMTGRSRVRRNSMVGSAAALARSTNSVWTGVHTPGPTRDRRRALRRSSDSRHTVSSELT